MTELLQQAIAQVQTLSDSQQNEIATLMMQAIVQQQSAIADDPQSAHRLLAQLANTAAIVWSPQTDSDAVQSLSNLLEIAQQSHHA